MPGTKIKYRLLLALYALDVWASFGFYQLHPAARWLLPALIVLILVRSIQADRRADAAISARRPQPPVRPGFTQPLPPPQSFTEKAPLFSFPTSIDLAYTAPRFYLERLLVVEPDPLEREVFAAALRERGYDVAVAPDADKAIIMICETRQLKRTPFSAAVIGSAPRTSVSAVEQGRRLRAAADGDLGLILMIDPTFAHAELGAASAMGEPPADDALSKPVDAAALVRAVQSTLNRRFEASLASA